MKKQFALTFLLLIISFTLLAKSTTKLANKNRDWWNILFYNITIEPEIGNKFLNGSTQIHFKKKLKTKDYILRLDLQYPMQISDISIQFIKPTATTSALSISNELIVHKTNYYLVNLSAYKNEIDALETIITINYSGKPKIAENAPWQGGWVFNEDLNKNSFISVACQTNGASLWYPCKDDWGDEPDFGAQLNIIVPSNLVGIGNGKLISKKDLPNNKTNYSWRVNNPINPYNIVPYIGNYKNFSEVYKGKKGDLLLDFWVLEENLEKAKNHFKQVQSMLTCFEEKLGPYPFYEDSYKLVEAPFVGMEHQSNIAYGNKFENGYLGHDISRTGLGLNWDYIIVHESGHEWFGNSITGKKKSDMWIHESFTTYTEGIYTSCINGKNAGDDYIIGLRANIKNDSLILNENNLEQEGSADMYSKGANIIHTFKEVLNNETIFYNLLRHLTKTLHNKTITSKDFINTINNFTKKNYTSFFNQYLKTTVIPRLLYKKLKNNIFMFRWDNNLKFQQKFPLKLTSGKWIYPSSSKWIYISLKKDELFKIDKNFYIDLKLVE